MSGIIRGSILCSALLVILLSTMPNFTFAASSKCPAPPKLGGPTSNGIPALYDLQYGLTYTNSITAISDNVNATWPVADPLQPTYLINGYTIAGNNHYWYQLFSQCLEHK